MSKSLGNVIRPKDMVQKYSADSLRYWASLPVLGEDVPFMEKELVAGKKFITKMLNAARFVSMATKGVKAGKIDKKKLLSEDKAILSRLNRLIKESTKAFERFEVSKAINPTRNFFWLQFADFYIEEVKTRVYNKKDESGKAAATVLQEVMWKCLLLLAPFLPHTTEEIAQQHFKKRLQGKSIHLEEWPEADEGMIDEKAEEIGELINAVIAKMRKHKTASKKPLNTPVKKAAVVVPSLENFKKAEEAIKRTMAVEEIEAKEGKELVVELQF